VEGYGVEDFREIPRKPWSRTGGKGAYIQLKGMESFTGMYIEYEDEDPRIRSDYIAAIRAEGVSFQMPDVSYHKD